LVVRQAFVISFPIDDLLPVYSVTPVGQCEFAVSPPRLPSRSRAGTKSCDDSAVWKDQRVQYERYGHPCQPTTTHDPDTIIVGRMPSASHGHR